MRNLSTEKTCQGENESNCLVFLKIFLLRVTKTINRTLSKTVQTAPKRKEKKLLEQVSVQAKLGITER